MKITLIIKRLLLTTILFTLFACKKESDLNITCNEKTNSLDIARKFLSATYTWAYTKVSFQGGSNIETPISTGKSYKYIFNKNGKVYYFENDTIKSIDNFVIDYEFKATTFPSDSATIVIISDIQTGQYKYFFRPYLCTDSALFYNPYNSINQKRYFKRN